MQMVLVDFLHIVLIFLKSHAFPHIPTYWHVLIVYDIYQVFLSNLCFRNLLLKFAHFSLLLFFQFRYFLMVNWGFFFVLLLPSDFERLGFFLHFLFEIKILFFKCLILIFKVLNSFDKGLLLLFKFFPKLHLGLKFFFHVLILLFGLICLLFDHFSQLLFCNLPWYLLPWKLLFNLV